MKDTNNIYKWTAEACRKIAFLPDRKAMERELTDHFEDHRDALLDGGMSAADAEELALRAMGDAEEVGEQLAQVYNNIWTKLWRFSRGALWTLLILFILCRLLISPYNPHKLCYFVPLFLEDYVQVYYDQTIYETYNERFSDDTIGEHLTLTNWTAGQLEANDDYMGFRWNVKKWARMHYKMEYNDLDPNDGPPPVPIEMEKMVVLLSLRDSRIYPGDVNLRNSDFHAVDNFGTIYQYAGNYLNAPNWSMMECGRILNHYYLEISLTPVADNVQWIELRAGDEDGLCLRIDLTKGEVLG